MRNWNLATGVVAIGLCVALVAGWAIRAATRPGKETMQTYVAYFDDAGGIRAGDRVRIKGRTAGTVLDARVVQHEGRTRVRVEIAISPGSGSQWLNEEGLAVDSELRVQKPRLMGSPQLAVSPGQSSQKLAPGGEIRRTVSAAGTDQLTEYKAELARIQDYVERALRFLDGPTLTRIIQGLDDARRRAAEIDAMLARGASWPAEAAPRLEEAARALADLRREVEARSADLAAGLERGASGTQQAEAGLGEFADGVARAAQVTADLNDSLARLAATLQSREIADAGRQLRRLSAQTRASQDRSRANPKTFGDMPTWRFLRRYYHGDTFTPGDGSETYDDQSQAPKGR
jgi:ABC-type transporter Mla subunit MlaD